MYMAPVVAAKMPPSPALRRPIGLLLVLLGVAVMLPWLAMSGAWIAAVLGIRGIAAVPRVFIQLVDHVGAYALGR